MEAVRYAIDPWCPAMVVEPFHGDVLKVRSPFSPDGYVSVFVTKNIRTSYSDCYNRFITGFKLMSGAVPLENTVHKFRINNWIDRKGKEHTKPRFDSAFEKLLVPVQHYLFTEGCNYSFSIANDALTILGGIYYFAAQMELLVDRPYVQMLAEKLAGEFDTLAKSGTLITSFDAVCKQRDEVKEHFPSGLPWYSPRRIFFEDREFMDKAYDALRIYAKEVYSGSQEFLDTKKVPVRFIDGAWWDPDKHAWIRYYSGNFDYFLSDIANTMELVERPVNDIWPVELRELGHKGQIYAHVFEFLFKQNLFFWKAENRTDIYGWSRSVFQVMFMAKVLKYTAQLRSPIGDGDVLFKEKKHVRAKPARKTFHRHRNQVERLWRAVNIHRVPAPTASDAGGITRPPQKTYPLW